MTGALVRMSSALRSVRLLSSSRRNPEARLELRTAAQSLLSALADDATTLPSGLGFDSLLEGLRSLQPRALQPDERHALTDALAPLHQALRTSNDDDVHRFLLDATPVGTTLCELLEVTEPQSLDPDAQLSFLNACERQLAWLHSRQDAGLVAFAGGNPRNTLYFVNGAEHELTDARRTEIAAELRWSEAMAHDRLTQARALLRDLPVAATAMAGGGIAPRRIAAICEGAGRLTASVDERLEAAVAAHLPQADLEVLREERRALLRAFEQRVVPYAEHHDLARTRAAISRAVSVIDPLGYAARRARAARRLCGIRIDQQADGMATLTATMPGEQAIACLRAIDSRAKSPQFIDPSQPIGVRRVAAMVSLLIQQASNATASGALPVRVDVVIDFATLIGLNDLPAKALGFGPLPADVVRELIANDARATVRRIITDPVTAAPIDVGRRRYRIDAGLRKLIEARDGTCRFTDCGQPAHRCECDHATAFEAGGATSTANLGLACKRHHQCKTHAGWQVIDSEPDGSCTWRSPHAREYRHEPLPLLPILELAPMPMSVGAEGHLCSITRRALALHHARTCSAAHDLGDCPRLRHGSQPEDEAIPF